MQEQQIVIDIPPEIYVSPENIADIKRLVREEICNRFFTWDEIRDYERRVAELVTEDDEPVDNIFSERQQKLLTQTLYTSWKPLNAAGEPLNFFAAANIGLYGKLDRHARIVPDVLVSLGVKASENVHEKRHRSYLIWEFGKPPELALEIVSNQEGDELGEKLAKYARLGIEYQ
jgi:Uma2 family endonuclease